LAGSENLVERCEAIGIAGCEVLKVLVEDFYAWEAGVCCCCEFLGDLMDPGSLWVLAAAPGGI